MLFNRVVMLLALFIGALTSQIPEFAQQYGQRLGGAIDELQHILQQFDADAAQKGMDRAAGIAALEVQPDEFVRERGMQISEIEARLGRLERQLRDFKASEPLGDLTVLAENFDPSVAQGTFVDFKPAVPVTTDGIVSGLVGFVVGLSLLHLCAWPIRHRRRMAHHTRAHTTSA